MKSNFLFPQFFVTLICASLLAGPVRGAVAPQGKSVASSGSVASPTGAVGPQDAPVTVVVFSDFECPFSAQMFFILEKLEQRYPTQLRVLMKQSPLDIHPGAPLAHRAALAAGKQGKFTKMAELLYGNQARQDMPSLLAYARQLNLDMVRFRRDMDSPEIAGAVNADMQESRGFGIQSTPTLFINGRSLVGYQTEENLASAVNTAIVQETGQKQAAAAEVAAATPLANELQVELLTSPTAERGDAAAPLTIVEFTDFQCPFCRQAVAPLEQLMAARGREVHWIFRAFPLDFHPDAEMAAEAALAAAAQGKFWEMHGAMFANQTALKPDDLRRYAEQVKLNMVEFDKALATHQYAGQVAADRALGTKAGVTGTPTFVIDGRAISGVRSLPELNQIADAHVGKGAAVTMASAVNPASAAVHAVLGPENASLTLTWFTDVRSPLAARQSSLVREIATHYNGKVRVVYKAFPLESYTDGALASAALLAALEQDAFWPMYDVLAQRRDVLDRIKLVGVARSLNLKVDVFEKDLDVSAASVVADKSEAVRRGIQGAPVIFLNSQRVDGLQRAELYNGIADGELAQVPVAAAAMKP